MAAATGMQDASAESFGVGQQDFDVFMDTLIQENPDVPFCEGHLLSDLFLDQQLGDHCDMHKNKPQNNRQVCCIGDLDLISELLPDLSGFDELDAAHSSTSKRDTSSQIDTSVRPISRPQAELDGMAFLQNIPETFDSYAPTASGNIYEAARNSMTLPVAASFQVFGYA